MAFLAVGFPGSGRSMLRKQSLCSGLSHAAHISTSLLRNREKPSCSFQLMELKRRTVVVSTAALSSFLCFAAQLFHVAGCQTHQLVPHDMARQICLVPFVHVSCPERLFTKCLVEFCKPSPVAESCVARKGSNHPPIIHGNVSPAQQGLVGLYLLCVLFHLRPDREK